MLKNFPTIIESYNVGENFTTTSRGQNQSQGSTTEYQNSLIPYCNFSSFFLVVTCHLSPCEYKKTREPSCFWPTFPGTLLSKLTSEYKQV